MALTNETVRHIAKLARLHLEEEELDGYRAKLESILAYVEKLQSADTSSVPEFQHAASGKNILREDEPVVCPERVRILALDNFSQQEEGLLAVQAVFDHRDE